VSFVSRYRAGRWVEIKSREEILATLDEHGEIDGLPFMPEMLKFCGKRIQVFASAHKTCDTVNHTGGRRMRGAVHLDELRCDGAAHGGCQAQCLFFWKDEWLRPAPEGAPAAAPPASAPTDDAGLGKFASTVREGESVPTYRCQATRLYAATTPLTPWNPRQYIADVRSGNVPARDAVKFLFLAALFNLRKLGVGYQLAVRLHEWAHRKLIGRPAPYGRGRVPKGTQTPLITADLRVGDVVEVKPHEEILDTLNARNHNRGMSFDKEMVRYCGQRFRVGDRVTHIINEQTGKMMEFSRPSYILTGTYCTSQYSERRMLCPRRIVPYWREAWLTKVGSAEQPAQPDRS
jgi:hypothetical protein